MHDPRIQVPTILTCEGNKMSHQKKTYPKAELVALIKTLIKSPELQQEIQDKKTVAVIEKIVKFLDKMQ